MDQLKTLVTMTALLLLAAYVARQYLGPFRGIVGLRMYKGPLRLVGRAVGFLASGGWRLARALISAPTRRYSVRPIRRAGPTRPRSDFRFPR